jgi:signal transduction histidine kinase/CheY-like chemotaxis protein
VDDSAAPIRDGRRRLRGGVLVFRDVSERHHAQEEARKAAAQMRQALRMEAIGRLAGGVAHDINNLMTVVIGCGDLLLAELPVDQPHHQLVKDMKDAGDRAVAMATQLLAFGRKQMLVPAVVSLNDIVERTEQMLRRIIREDIRVACDLSPSLGRVKIDPGQMEQVIVNLALNARDAMPDGGTITLRTMDVRFEERSPDRAPEVRPGPYVALTVSDTGTGMDPATRAHIFEPFFTTKPSGKGTGLGLATVYGIVKQSDGYIYVQSELGRGSTFTIYLPEVADAVTPPPPAESTIQPRGTETVLLVEDDDGVRAIARLILQRSGYTILEATDGAEALRLYERHPGHIDLLLTDAVMPNMGGRTLAERFTAARPGVKVLFMSSYTPDDSLRLGVQKQQAAFLQKPFTAGTLTRKVRQVLDDGLAPS